MDKPEKTIGSNEQTEESEKSMAEDLEIADAIRGLMKPGGVMLGLGFALAGWYLSQVLGPKWLWIGIGAGTVIGGGSMLLLGRFSAYVVHKTQNEPKSDGDKKL